MEQNQYYFESRLSRMWTPDDVVYIALGRKVMKVKVNEPSYFDISDIVIFSGNKMPSGAELMGRVYSKTDDGELLIMPLNGFPQSYISILVILEHLVCDETSLPDDFPTQEPTEPEGDDTALPPAPQLQEPEAKQLLHPIAPKSHHPRPLRSHNPPIARNKASHRLPLGYPRPQGEVPDG